MSKLNQPIDAVIAVTYRCNSRCIMCDIWKIKDFPELAPTDYLKLPKSLRDVNISGGEPFLRNDLVEIIKNVKKACPKAYINISTNGFLVDTIKKVLPEIKKIQPKIAISVSVDGMGDMHEQVRRVPDAWEKVVETVRFCRDELKIKNLKVAFTVNEQNYKQLNMVYDWCVEMKIQFTMAIVHSSGIFFGRENSLKVENKILKNEFDLVSKKLLKSFRPKDWVKAFFVDGLYKVASGEKRPLESFSGEDYFYLDPKGDVYPSVIDNVVMGNINNFENFNDLWDSEQAQKARDDVKGFENNYWMVCTARSGIKRNPLKVAKLVLVKKIKRI